MSYMYIMNMMPHYTSLIFFGGGFKPNFQRKLVLTFGFKQDKNRGLLGKIPAWTFSLFALCDLTSPFGPLCCNFFWEGLKG